MKQIPTVLIAILAIVVYKVPRLSEWFVYSRQAVLGGEFWRLLSAPLVHFTAGHLFWDLVVFAAASWAIHASGFRGFWWVCGFSIVIPGLMFLLAFPELERYGGLSGLATGAVAYLCLCGAQSYRRNRPIWIAGLLLTGIKIILEVTTGTPIFAHAESLTFRVLPSAHLAGFIGALITFIGMHHSRKNNDIMARPAHPEVPLLHR